MFKLKNILILLQLGIASMQMMMANSSESILTFRTDTATTVYNLEASGNHNYYVSPSGVLVHNKAASGKYFAQLSKLTKGLNKILKDVDEGIVDLSKFNNKGVYKHWKLVKDNSAGKPTAHKDSFWKLLNTNEEGFRRTLDVNGKILGD